MRSLSMPWFETFRQEYVHSCRFNFWDTLDHPLGMILALSSKEDNVVQQFRNMDSSLTNELFGAYCVDPGIFKTYVLVHDAEEEAPDMSLNATFAQLKQEFGVMHTKVLVLNGNRRCSDPCVPFHAVLCQSNCFWGGRASNWGGRGPYSPLARLPPP